MTDEERRAARAALISGVTIRQLIADLEGKRYADLVAKHMREIGTRLPSTIAVHEDLILPEEGDGVREIRTNVAKEAMQPRFWAVDAGDFLSSVSCDLNDALFPTPADEAGVFNLFQLITATLADRARLDADFRRTILEPLQVSTMPSPELGTITRMLGIAISDYDAGRISRGQLLSIFQGAIDNGDILEENNQMYVVANVLPLVDAGLLRSSEHLRTFEDRMNKMAANLKRGYMATELTYEDVLVAARSKVAGAESRFADEPSPFRATWWPGVPTFEQELLSDYGVESSMPDLSKEFFEEVSAIRDSLKELGHKGELAPWQRSGLEAGKRMMEGLNRHAEALGLWDELCFPMRRRGDLVFRIKSPGDAMGTPIIQALSLDGYVRGVTVQTARAAIEIAALTRSRDKWRVAAAVLGLILLLVLVTWAFAA